MLFRSQGKVQDVGKDNLFNEFMKREKESSKLTQQSIQSRQMTLARSSKSNYDQPSINNTQSLQQQKPKIHYKEQQFPPRPSELDLFPLPSPIQLIQDGSCRSNGSTWDAIHLDQFLKSSRFVKTGDLIYKNTLTSHEDTVDQTHSQLPKYSQFSMSKTPKIQASQIHGFQSLKYGPVRVDFQEEKLLEVPQKLYNQSKLNYKSNPLTQSEVDSQLTHPNTRRKELDEAKQNLELYQNWRSDYFDRNKQYKSAKNNRYNTGILSQLREVTANSPPNQINTHRQSTLKKFNDANPSLQFNNSNHIKQLVPDNKEDVLLKMSKKGFPQQNFELQHDWNTKKMSNKETHTLTNRLFGSDEDFKSHKVSERALFLRSQELRGKDYNLINMDRNDYFIQDPAK